MILLCRQSFCRSRFPGWPKSEDWHGAFFSRAQREGRKSASSRTAFGRSFVARASGANTQRLQFNFARPTNGNSKPPNASRTQGKARLWLRCQLPARPPDFTQRHTKVPILLLHNAAFSYDCSLHFFHTSNLQVKASILKYQQPNDILESRI